MKAFTILVKDVDGRRTQRYFKDWHRAEEAMMRDVAYVKRLTRIVGWFHIDRMNTENGFYEREETLIGKGGMRFHYALVDGYFED